MVDISALPAPPIGQVWTQRSENYVSTLLNGKRLDYWPNRGKFTYGRKQFHGTVATFIANHQSETAWENSDGK